MECDGHPPCSVCRGAARVITAAGHHVEHASRYDALRAAASGAYGFDACVITLAPNEGAVGDAVRLLLAPKRVALVVDDPDAFAMDLPEHFAVIAREDYRSGKVPLGWLSAKPIERSGRPLDRPLASVFSAPEPAAPLHPSAPQAARRVAALAARARQSAAAAATEPADPDLLIDDQIAWAGACGLPFSLVVLHLSGLANPAQMPADDQTAQTLEAAEAAIAQCVRRGDGSARRGDEYSIVLAEAHGKEAQLVAARVAAGILRQPFATRVPTKDAAGTADWTIGIAVYPDDGTTREALIDRTAANARPLKSVAVDL